MDFITAIKDFVNFLASPSIFLGLATVFFALALIFYRQWTKPAVALTIGIIVFGGYFLAALDPNFLEIVRKPDNIPITMMLLLFAFFLWFSLRRMAINDERIEQGLPPVEKTESDQKVLVWPDLVYSEFLATVLCTVFLLAWALLFQAPLEEPANAAKSPNPAKAPWYFLGLQEMLVYFDPWIAGVILPSLIITGLICLPYVDINKKGNGYFTFAERRFAVTIFLFGFVVLWLILIFLGTFLRGPNWYFFGPFEEWNAHKVVAESNIDLSEIIYVKMLGMARPSNWLVREIFGLTAVVSYLFVIPVLVTYFVPFFRRMYQELGLLRYTIVIAHLVIMFALPIKMLLRWFFNLKYLVFIPEFFFNI